MQISNRPSGHGSGDDSGPGLCHDQGMGRYSHGLGSGGAVSGHGSGDESGSGLCDEHGRVSQNLCRGDEALSGGCRLGMPGSSTMHDQAQLSPDDAVK